MAFEWVLPYLDFFMNIMYFIVLFISGIIFYVIAQFLGVDDWLREFLLKAYDGVKGIYGWFIQTFHYNNPEEILALTILYFIGMVILVYNIGGEGVGGVAVDPNAEGLFGLSGEGVTIGSDLVVMGVDGGLAESRGKALTTIDMPWINTTPNVTTTITLDLTCDSNADCALMSPNDYTGEYKPFCCPANTGECVGYCNADCLVDCETYCAEYDYSVNPPDCLRWECVSGTEDYAPCIDSCERGSCKKSWGVVYIISPTNESVEDNDTVILDWVSA